MADVSTPDVRNDPAGSRFVVEQNGVEAALVYHQLAGRLVLIHTEVPEELGGHGIGGRLVRAALDHARANALTIVPWCPFARRWLTEHASEAEGVPIDWDTLPPSDDTDA
jgi:predicted GNAT family acetyltransferase